MIRALRNRNSEVDERKIGEYIACSAPLHLTDGWNYLSRAFCAASQGDQHVAYHLAYYAELRATMSLLAAEGIGLFQNRHIALDDHLQPTELRGRQTHQAAWEILSAWSDAGKAARLLDTMSLEARSFSGWLESVGVTEQDRSRLSAKLLEAWSVDLRTMSEDVGRRNEMSYRPTRIRTAALSPVDPRQEIVDPLFASWDMLEPSFADTPRVAHTPRVALDAPLLCRALELAASEGVGSYRTLDASLSALKSGMPGWLHRELTAENPSASSIFRNAGITKGSGAPPILARGLLMLRLASASAASLLTAADISGDIRFWWSALGSDLGLWENQEEIGAFSDLWADVADAIDTARAKVEELPPSVSVHAVSGILSREASLTQFVRAPMWLLDLG